METEDIAPTMQNPAPVIVACEMAMAVVPVFVKVKVCGLLDPGATFPKFKLVALAASVPEDVEFELDCAAGVPAPVKPVQPASDSAARHPRIRENMPSGARRLGAT